MTDSEVVLYFFIIILALVHTFSEVIYKKGVTPIVESKKASDNYSKQTWIMIVFVVGFSIGISLCVKLLFGIILGSNPLSIISGLFLGSIAIFSFIFGYLFFDEKISRTQLIGFCFISIGIFLLV